MRRQLLCLLLLAAPPARACTTILAGRGATADGSTLLLHTDDGGDLDFRLGRTHPRDVRKPWPVLRKRPQYPREVSDRSPTYSPDSLDATLPADLLDRWRSAEWAANQTIGKLVLDPSIAVLLGVDPDTTRTFGALEGAYAIVNEKQVAIVESTCEVPPFMWSPARPPATPGRPHATRRDGALWDMGALTQVALALCATARCAVDLMGHLAVRDGFYGEDGSDAAKPFGGENVMVADPEEGWMLEVSTLPPDVAAGAGVEGADGGYSAVWVAKRVPDGHFAMVANRFTIRDVVEVTPDESTRSTLACRGEEVRHSSNLFALAEHIERHSLNPMPFESLPAGARRLEGGGLRVTDWARTFGFFVRPDYASYTNGRIWRVLSVLAPQGEWRWPAATPLANEYAWSHEPSRPLTAADILALARDVYRDVAAPGLDVTRGLASGPHGDPSRYDDPQYGTPGEGGGGPFPRAISIFRTSYSHLIELGRRGGWLAGARVWLSQGAPHAAVYTPVHVQPAAADAGGSVADMPASLTSGSLHRADALDGAPASTSVFWRTTLLNNWARAVGYDFAWGLIEAAQREVEAATRAAADRAEEAAAAAGSEVEAARLLAEADSAAAALSAQRHHDLIAALMTRLHDGYLIEPHAPKLQLTKLWYPSWWLERVGFYTQEAEAMPPREGLPQRTKEEARPRDSYRAEWPKRAAPTTNLAVSPVPRSPGMPAAAAAASGLPALTVLVALAFALGTLVGSNMHRRLTPVGSLGEPLVRAEAEVRVGFGAVD